MKNYIPLRIHSDNSLLKSPSRIDQISKRVQELEFPGCALTDCGNIAGAVQFISSCKKKKIKPILGIEFNLCTLSPKKKEEENKKLHTIVLLAKNFQGYKTLLEIVSTSNHPNHFHYQPRLDLQTLASYIDNNIICIDGYVGSYLSALLLEGEKLDKALIMSQLSEISDLLNEDYQALTIYTEYMVGVFGKNNYFLGVSLTDQSNLPVCKVVGKTIRMIGANTNTPTVAIPNSYYLNKEDFIDQRVLLCVGLNTSMSEIDNKIIQSGNFETIPFLKSSNYYLPTYQEMIECGHTEQELATTLEIGNMCEEYDITHAPIMPNFTPPDSLSSGEYVRKLCRKGWLNRKEKIYTVIRGMGLTNEDYGARFKEEFGVLEKANLFNYFLIIYDIIQFAKNNGIYIGAGRGSVGGSLIAYLMGLTEVDPIEYNLLFSRFYNQGRNTKNRISLPDIDTDVEVSGREPIMNYLRKKYGPDNVAQIATFGRMQGRACLKDVLRVWSSCSFSEMNTITQYIPDESKISDQLSSMKGEVKNGNRKEKDVGIIQWALENNSEQLKEWAYLDEENNIQGILAKRFEQAKKLEGTKRSLGRHAAGIVISDRLLRENCPLIYSSSDNMRITGWEMNDTENVGLVKIDLLGLNLLDKLHTIVDLLEEN